MYKVVLNSDRVHISNWGRQGNVPLETHLFSKYADKYQDGKEIAVGLCVLKAMSFNDGIKNEVIVIDLSK